MPHIPVFTDINIIIHFPYPMQGNNTQNKNTNTATENMITITVKFFFCTFVLRYTHKDIQANYYALKSFRLLHLCMVITATEYTIYFMLFSVCRNYSFEI